MNIESLLRMIFGTAVRAGVYRGIRSTGGIFMILLILGAAIGYAFLA